MSVAKTRGTLSERTARFRTLFDVRRVQDQSTDAAGTIDGLITRGDALVQLGRPSTVRETALRGGLTETTATGGVGVAIRRTRGRFPVAIGFVSELALVVLPRECPGAVRDGVAGFAVRGSAVKGRTVIQIGDCRIVVGRALFLTTAFDIVWQALPADTTFGTPLADGVDLYVRWKRCQTSGAGLKQ